MGNKKKFFTAGCAAACGCEYVAPQWKLMPWRESAQESAQEEEEEEEEAEEAEEAEEERETGVQTSVVS